VAKFFVPNLHLTRQSKRTGIENKWFALTGRVVAVKTETDGDIHIALQDATGDKPGIVIVEVSEKPQWCSIRETVFSWTRTRFPKVNALPHAAPDAGARILRFSRLGHSVLFY